MTHRESYLFFCFSSNGNPFMLVRGALLWGVISNVRVNVTNHNIADLTDTFKETFNFTLFTPNVLRHPSSYYDLGMDLNINELPHQRPTVWGQTACEDPWPHSPALSEQEEECVSSSENGVNAVCCLVNNPISFHGDHSSLSRRSPLGLFIVCCRTRAGQLISRH